MTDKNKLHDTILDMEASLSTNLNGYSMWHYGADIHGITRETLKNAIEALKAQEPKGKAYWIQRAGRGHGWNCSNCGEKINYNEEQKTRQKRVLPVWLVNKYCRGCGREMTWPPADE